MPYLSISELQGNSELPAYHQQRPELTYISFVMNFTLGNRNENDTILPIAQSGYDLEVFGLDTGKHFASRLTTLLCSFLSLASVIAILVSSFTNKTSFSKWNKGGRFIVYLALCDGPFNFCTILDGLQTFVTKNHIYPQELCIFYAMMVIKFVFAQYILVCIIAVNVFMLLYYRKDLDFGVFDWKVIVPTFGIPFIAAIIAASLDALGPNGHQ